MSAPRIPRDYMDDESLARGRHALLAQTTTIGAMQLRAMEGPNDVPEAAEMLRRDGEAVTALLGMVLAEQGHRRIEDDAERSVAAGP